MSNKKRLLTIGVLVAMMAMFLAVPSAAVYAQESNGLLPDCATQGGEFAGTCSSCELLSFFGILSQRVTLYAGGATLFAVFAGGVYWLTSFGNAQRVQRGKQIFIGAVIGTALVFGGYTIVNTTILAFSGSTSTGTATLFKTEEEWNQICEAVITPPAPATPEPSSQQSSEPEINPATGVPVDGQSCTSPKCSDNCVYIAGICAPPCIDYGGECIAQSQSDSCATTISASGDCPSSTPVCCEAAIPVPPNAYE